MIAVILHFKKITSVCLIVFALACSAFLPQIQAAPDGFIAPPPDGCYPAFTTAEGCNALAGLTSGQANTGLGWFALFSAGNSNFNTAVGAGTLVFNTGDSNTAIGTAALLFNTAAADNTAVGTSALLNNDSSGNGTGQFNTAVGSETLQANVDGTENTAVGFQALSSNLASRLTAVGTSALFANINATANTAIGDGTLVNNDAMGHGVANDNTAVGFTALSQNFEGANNTAVGSQALALSDANGNGLANGNTAVGAAALASNLDGAGNTAVGFQALFSNAGGKTSGNGNTAVGQLALHGNTTGLGNTAIGDGSMFNSMSGSLNTVVGASAGPFLGSNGGSACTYIGAGVGPGVDENSTIRIADNTAAPLTATQCFIGGIAGVNAGAPNTAVLINTATGQLGTVTSSERFKKDINSMGNMSEAIFSLRPVTFHYKGDSTNTPNCGLIAEEVAKVNPDLIIVDNEGKPETVRYEQINAMLLNEFLKEHRKNEELKKDFQATVAQLTTRIDEQAAQIQKVSAQLEASKPAPQVVNNP